MENRNYTAQDIWDVLVAASVERISIEMASQLLEKAPSGTTVRTRVKKMLQQMGELPDVEKQLNELLTANPPRKLFKSKLPAAIDLTGIPYHGHHAEDDPYVRRGQVKQGATHFYVFASSIISWLFTNIGAKAFTGQAMRLGCDSWKSYWVERALNY